MIEDHRKHSDHDDDPPVDPPKVTTKSLFKLFFGLEVGCGRRAKCGGAYAANYNSNGWMENEEEKMLDESEEETLDQICQQDIIIRRGGSSSGRRSSGSSAIKKGGNKRLAKRRFEQPLATVIPLQNPYSKKSYPCEV